MTKPLHHPYCNWYPSYHLFVVPRRQNAQTSHTPGLVSTQLFESELGNDFTGDASEPHDALSRSLCRPRLMAHKFLLKDNIQPYLNTQRSGFVGQVQRAAENHGHDLIPQNEAQQRLTAQRCTVYSIKVFGVGCRKTRQQSYQSTKRGSTPKTALVDNILFFLYDRMKALFVARQNK